MRDIDDEESNAVEILDSRLDSEAPPSVTELAEEPEPGDVDELESVDTEALLFW